MLNSYATSDDIISVGIGNVNFTMKKSTLSFYKIMGKSLIEFRTIKISPRGGFMSRGANTVRLLPVVIIV